MRVGLVLGPDDAFGAPLQCQRNLFKALTEMDTGLDLVPIKNKVPRNLDILHLDNLPFRWWEYARTYLAPNIVCHVHGNIIWSNPELMDYTLMKRAKMKVTARLARRRIDHFLPVSNYLRHFLEDWGADHSKCRTVYNGIDPGFFIKPRGRRPIKSPYILHVSKYQPKKNTEALVRAFSRVRREYPDMELVIAGPGHMDDGGTGIHYLGKVPSDYLIRLYQHSEIFVFPSLHETFGIPVVEAMASGVPVIITRRASLPEVGGNAAIYAEPDFISLSRAMIDLLEKPILQGFLRDRGLARAKNFTWENAAAHVLEVYEEVGRR